MKRMCLLCLFWLGITPLTVSGQDPGRILGSVTESGTARPLVGATVHVVGTQAGTLTGPDGRFVLTNVAAGTHEVRVSMFGYGSVSQTVAVSGGDARTLNFALQLQAIALEGIVAVGYGTQARRRVTGAVASVQADKIGEVLAADPVKAMQGRVAGVEIASYSNLPGDSMNIRIRGIRSLTASSEPLYVVDGIPISGSLQDFSPSNIQSVEILKDASATAIYGSRAANGVVLVTTKSGAARGGSTEFSAQMYYGASRPLQLIEMMDMEQYVTMLQAAARFAGMDTSVTAVIPYEQMLAAYRAGIQTDWQREILRTGNQRNLELGLVGTSGETRFSLAGSIFDQTGLAVGQAFGRVTGAGSVEHTLGRLRLGVTANVGRSVQEVGQGNGLWGQALAQTGFGAPYDAEGALVTRPDGEQNAINPVRIARYDVNEVTRTRLFASAFSDLELSPGLHWRVNFGPDVRTIRNGRFMAPDVGYPALGYSRASVQNREVFAYTLDNLLQFNREFGRSHQLDATLLYGRQSERTVADSISARDLPYFEQLWYGLNTAGTPESQYSNLSEWALESYMARTSYTFRDRYTVAAAVRRDGSSRLAAGNKWHTFPSLGVAWQVGDERFLRRIEWLSALKLRGSYGVTGNTAIQPYQTQGTLLRTTYNLGGSTAPGFVPNPGNPANPFLTWEKTYKSDVGADFGVLNNRVSGSIDLYREDTRDLLMLRTLPSTSGYTQALQNIGETRNQGIELTITTVNIDRPGGLRWTSDLTWAANRNEITALATADTTGCPVNARPCDLNNGWFVGQPINLGGRSFGNRTPTSPLGGLGTDGQPNADQQRRVWYDYKMMGIWQLGEEEEARSYGTDFRPGEIRLFDANGDGRITPADQVVLGNTYPRWTGSLYNRLEWRGVDLSALVSARWGYMIFDAFNANTNSMQGRFGNIVTDYWTEGNPSRTQPAPRLNGNPVPFSASRGYRDASHWRIRNVTLGYTLPQPMAGRFGASRSRVYATAQDPFFFSDYEGYDPENGTQGSAPAFRTVVVGASVGF
jgi:TonB-linked SusC/RagA family outer membrane protein